MKLSKRAANGLEKSIKHWHENYNAVTPDEVKTGSDECALCALYSGNTCTSCPVYKDTGISECRGTPYEGAYSALSRWRQGLITRSQWCRACMKEIKYLKGLRGGGMIWV